MPTRTHRTAFTLLEILVATVLLIGLMTVCVQLVRATITQRRVLGWRQMAVGEAANAAERIHALAWDELTDARLESFELLPNAASTLPSGDLTVASADDPDVPAETVARRFDITVTWQPPDEPSPLEVGLVLWRYQPPNTSTTEASP